ncbi:hypothetical protein M422DRAFT_263368 [Sphaerobolus stellatus SS14]|uniref:Uncharacterized protein n=1 Tax=Sphaerobolus stellatus (strain SS14) TaxID=990650 RepID=A0A0C9UI96_SPHS4|nr:hypothetical protein M422DRAFT_263368 [Sphaerobolus stellatus SS14]
MTSMVQQHRTHWSSRIHVIGFQSLHQCAQDTQVHVQDAHVCKASLSGDAPRFPSGTITRVKHPLESIPRGIHPQHIRRLLWLESGMFGWRQWSFGGGYMRM